MRILPAIDIYDKKAVRLYKGDYNQMTVYGTPLEIAKGFAEKGADYIHLVDLQGAKDGNDTNFSVISEIINTINVPCEIGGGIRNIETVEKYLSIGADRVIIGTAAVSDKVFLCEAVKRYGAHIAVGVDARDGIVAINGWTEQSGISTFDFIGEMLDIGVKTIICTDISRDGALNGTNVSLYKEILAQFDVNLIASGGVTNLDDLRMLKECGVYGAILGKAIYNGNIALEDALAI